MYYKGTKHKKKPIKYRNITKIKIKHVHQCTNHNMLEIHSKNTQFLKKRGKYFLRNSFVKISASRLVGTKVLLNINYYIIFSIVGPDKVLLNINVFYAGMVNKTVT